MQYDVLIIGAGPGGYVAAIRAAQLNLKTAIIEKEKLGGVCLNSGCIPTKSLLKSAEILSYMKNSEEYGIKVDNINIDLGKIVSRAFAISSKLTLGIKYLLKKNNVDVISGYATLLGNNSVIVNDDSKETIFTAKNIIIATGARARILDGFSNNKNIWTYKDALNPSKIPKSITIIGSGAIGMEFASFYHSIGSKVTILESRENILPSEDAEISKLAREIVELKGIKCYSSIKLNSSYEISGDDISISFTNSNLEHVNITAEILLLAVGIIPNTNSIGLENTKALTTGTGHIITNEYMLTNEPNLYAIGDVTDGPWLAHKASHEGVLVAEKIAGLKTDMIDKLNIPRCVYSMPQIASIGLTEEEASKKCNIRIGRFPFSANGTALILGKGAEKGMIKTIFDKDTGELIGMHMIGTSVTELIHSGAIYKSLEAVGEDISKMIFPHPTLSEMIHESALNAFGHSIHI